ncbi:hypothetical protein C1H76_9550 [Elsinoe australis]|uniref:WW domain-containing protein n=1 Tax=Elsinoe australis TaxID=40998 RepID=A0A4V6DSW4_9PEZI|nr:hypothetical protein C1H76_9550 [Elsinoe australis]
MTIASPYQRIHARHMEHVIPPEAGSYRRPIHSTSAYQHLNIHTSADEEEPSYSIVRYLGEPELSLGLLPPSTWKSLEARWRKYQNNEVLLYQHEYDQRPQCVQAESLFTSKPPWPWEICLLQTDFEEELFYLLCFFNHETKTMEENFPPGYAFMTGVGFVTADQVELVSKDQSEGNKVLTACEFKGKRIPADFQGSQICYLMSWAGYHLEVEEAKWRVFSDEDKAAMVKKARKYYAVDLLQSGSDSADLRGQHRFERPHSSRIRWPPRNSENDLPVGWEAWIYLPTGRIFFYDKVARKHQATHPTKDFCTEGLPHGWALAWEKKKGRWRTYYSHYQARHSSWFCPEGYTFVRGQGFKTKGEVRELEENGQTSSKTRGSPPDEMV